MSEDDNTNGLAEQIDTFFQTYVQENNRHWFSHNMEELDTLLLSANFNKEENLYLRENEAGVQLFTPGDLFDYNMREIRLPNFDALHQELMDIQKNQPVQQPHYLALVQLKNHVELEEFNQRKRDLHKLVENEGMTHRGMNGIDANRKGYLVGEALKILPWAMGAGVLAGLVTQKPLYGGITCIGSVALPIIEDIRKLRKIDKLRESLKQEYKTEHEKFKADYEPKTLFDKEALQMAVGIYSK